MAKKIFSCVLAALLASAVYAKQVVMLRDDGALRKDNKKGGAEWAMNIAVGTEFEWDGSTVFLTDVNNSNKPNTEFYKVKYQGEEYFVRKTEAIDLDDKRIGVITTTATLFDKARPSSFRNAFLETATFVVIGQSEAPYGIGFSEVYFWDSSAWTVKKRYVQETKLSYSEANIKAVRFITHALSLKDKEMRKNYIEKALDVVEDGSIREFIQAEMDKVAGTVEEIGAVNVKIKTGNGDNLNVRADPVDGEVIETVVDGASGYATKKSSIVSKIDGIEENWYYVEFAGDVKAGWLFGGYLDFSQE